MNFPIDYAEEIADLFKSLHKTYQQYIQSQVACHNFTAPQLMVLRELYHHPAITLTELSKRVSLAKSTVSGIVDRLESQGVVKRVKVSEDRRIARISLTEEVSAIKEKLEVIRKNHLTELFKNIDAADLEKMLIGLKQLDDLMNNLRHDEHLPIK